MKAENISENTRIRWTKEVNKIVVRYFYQSDPTKRGYRKQMMKIWREIGVFDVTEQRLADQTGVIRTNGWLSKAELDEIQRKIKEEENTEKLRTELQNTCDQQRLPQDADDVELKNIENLFKRLQDQWLMNDEIWLVEWVAEQMKTDKAQPNLRNFDRKKLISKSDEINSKVLKRVLNIF